MSRARSYLTMLLVVGCTIDDYEGCTPQPKAGSICVTPGPERLAIDCGQNLTCDHASRMCVGSLVRGTCPTGDCLDDTLVCVEGRCFVDGGDGDVCGGDADCLALFTCEEGRCTRRLDCVDDGDCVIGRICESGMCEVGERSDGGPPCGPTGCTTCSVDSDCGREDLRCFPDGTCGRFCSIDDDCTGGPFICDMGRCRLPDMLTCETNAECTGGQVCVGDSCEDCTSSDQCDETQECGRRMRCVAPGLQHFPCSDDDQCEGFCDDDDFCTNGDVPLRCDVDTPCEPPLVCNGGVMEVAEDPTQGRCTELVDNGPCSYDAWTGSGASVGCNPGRVCVPDGRFGLDDDTLDLWIACAADPSGCVGAPGRCRGPVMEGPCITDAGCETGECVALDPPVATVETEGFDCTGGSCTFIAPWAGSCWPGDEARPGEACIERSDCMDGTFCDGAICRAENTALVGERCRGHQDRQIDVRCAFGLLCMSDGLCHAVGEGGLGDSCSERDDCGADFGCEGGECVARAREGQPCTANLLCAEDHWCEPETNLCLTGGALGADDGCDEDSTNRCGTTLYCDLDAMMCMRAALPGEACADRPCLGGYECSAGTCTGL